MLFDGVEGGEREIGRVIYAFTCATCLHVRLHVSYVKFLLTFWWILNLIHGDICAGELHNRTCVFNIQNEAYFTFHIFLSLSQEVILKRAADLVEALYGLPHNNQVGTRITKERGICVEAVIFLSFYCNYLMFCCRRSSWSVQRTLQKHSTASQEDTPSFLAPATLAWWGSTHSLGSCLSTSPSLHKLIRVRTKVTKVFFLF